MNKIQILINKFLRVVTYNIDCKAADIFYLKLLYRRMLGKKLDLVNPKTFNEKLQWLKLYDHNKIYSILVDKLAVKQYVAEKIGEEHVVKAIGRGYNSFEDIDFSKLPNSFVLKCNHDSGSIYICKDKNDFEYEKAKSIINHGLKTNYYKRGREWGYKNVEPQVFVEEYINCENLHDYKIMCFGGKPEMIEVDIDRFTGHKRNLYDTDWNLLDIVYTYERVLDREIEKPEALDEMLMYAGILSEGIPFARVDFYYADGRILFGEITLYPDAGYTVFQPDSINEFLGKKIILPDVLK